MQHSIFQRRSSPPVISDLPDEVLDIPSSHSTISTLYGSNKPPANRTLVLCFDGTGDQFNADNSNVVKLFNMLVKKDPSQLVYYQAGIGTYTIPDVATPLTAKLYKMMDSAFGNHLDAHVMGGYEFLMQNYHDGDKICLFGFSRGAYTARALAGMIEKVGLLPRSNHQQVPFAYHMYSRDDNQGWTESSGFKDAFSNHVKIDFVGVWDTVSSVGFIPNKRLPFTRGTSNIKVFRHALSLDERRVDFKPCTWQRPNKRNLEMRGLEHEDGQFPSPREGGPTIERVKEVWFAGNHSDIGGGSVMNDTRNSLSRIPLRWMIRECIKADVGIRFRLEMFEDIGMDYTRLYPVVKDRPEIIYHSTQLPSPDSESRVKDLTKKAVPIDFEELEDVADAITKAHDEINKGTLWWWWRILERVPRPVFYQDDGDDDRDVTTWKINKGLGRFVSTKYGLNVHRSVQIRMKSLCLEDGKYKPNAKVDLSQVNLEWVD